MLAKELISDVIPFLKPSDLGIEALNWMEIFRVSHLPIVEDDTYIGLVSDNDIYDRNLANEKIGKHLINFPKSFVYENQHIYDVISVAAGQKISALPVLNTNNQYIGLITIADLLYSVNNITGADNPGSLLVLEQSVHDYSLSEIAQIVESNDAKIISCYTNTSSYSTLLEVVIKVNRIELTSIIQTFMRYNYTIKATYSASDKHEDLNQERFDAFMSYLNV